MGSLTECPAPHCRTILPSSPRFCTGCGLPLPGADLQRRYEIRDVLGSGGFGVTYTVWDTREQQECVLKVLHVAGASASKPEEEQEKQKAIELFRRETAFLQRGLHPGLPAYIGDFEERNYPCLLMEKIEGRNLLDEMEGRGRPYTETELMPLIIQLTEILGVVHGEGILHRDIKPENIMRRRVHTAGQPGIKLIDLGGAREMDARYYAQMGGVKKSATQTLSGITGLHTPGYAPTEQIHGRPVIPSDLYAVGATMIHLLTGKHPKDLYDPHNLKFLWHKEIPASVSGDLVQIIDKLTAAAASERFSSAADLKSYLERVGEGFTLAGVAGRGGNAQGGRIDPAQIRFSSSYLSFQNVQHGKSSQEQLLTIQNEGTGTLEAAVSTDRPDIIEVRPTRIQQNKGEIRIGVITHNVDWGQTYKAAVHVEVETCNPPYTRKIPISVQVDKNQVQEETALRIKGAGLGATIGALTGTSLYLLMTASESGQQSYFWYSVLISFVVCTSLSIITNWDWNRKR